LKLLQQDHRLKKKLLFFSLAFLPLVIFFGMFFLEAYRKIRSEPLTAWQTDASADCAVVLTGGAGRIREAISLLTRGLVKKLIISGVHPDVELRDLYQMGPYTYGWNDEDIVLEKKSSTTFGNAQQSWPLVEALNCRGIVLVTSQLHMPRAYLTFQKAFPEGFALQKHTIPPSQSEASIYEISTEVIKTLFYSIWAY